MEIKKKRSTKSWWWKWTRFLIQPHPLPNFEIQSYYENESRFNGVYSRGKDGWILMNFDKAWFW